MTGSKRLHVSLSIHYTGIGFTSAAVALAQHMPPQFEPILYLPQVYGRVPEGVASVRPLPPLLPAQIAYRPSVMAWAAGGMSKTCSVPCTAKGAAPSSGYGLEPRSRFNASSRRMARSSFER